MFYRFSLLNRGFERHKLKTQKHHLCSIFLHEPASCYCQLTGSIPLVCMSKCPWARYGTPNCSWCWSTHCTAASTISVWMYVWITASHFGQKHLLKTLNVNVAHDSQPEGFVHFCSGFLSPTGTIKMNKERTWWFMVVLFSSVYPMIVSLWACC